MFIDKEKKFDKKGNYFKKKTFPALPTVSFTRYFLNILTVGRIHKNKSTCSSASLSVYYSTVFSCIQIKPTHIQQTVEHFKILLKIAPRLPL